MKLSLATAALILVAGVIFGWQDRGRLTTLREEQRRLVAEAGELGIPVGDDAHAAAASRTDRRAQDSAASSADARALAADMVEFALKLKEAQERPQPPDPEQQKAIFGLLDKLLEMDRDQIKVLIAELRRSPELDDEMRRNLIGFSIAMLANDHPEAALALFTETSDLLEADGIGSQMIAGALSKLAERDPTAALEWIRQQSTSHPGLVNDQTKAGIIAGVARQDPTLAFQLIDELGLEDVNRAAGSIAAVARSPGQRSAMLDAMRSQLETTSDPDRREELARTTLRSLSSQMAQEGFDSSISWLEDNPLEPDEIEDFCSGLGHWQTRDDTGRWIDWMSDKLPAEQLDSRVRSLVAEWTRADYAAAGEWINNREPGPARDPAVHAFAEAVAPYEPETAANWAVTLPDGPHRNELLRMIHSQWQGKDEAAAAEFARQHGLGESKAD